MQLPNVKGLFNSVMRFGHDNQAEILSALAITGLWTSMWLSYKAGPRAEKVLESKRKDLSDADPKDKKTRRTVIFEGVKELVPVIGPPLATGIISTVCVVKSTKYSRGQIATLSAAYAIKDAALREHKEKARELLGESKAQQIRESISKDHIGNVVIPKDDSAIPRTGLGDTLCYDEYTDRLFYCSAEAIGKAVVKLSYDLQSEMWIDLNDFYQEINLKPCKMGNDLGWSVDKSDRGRIPVYYTAILTDDNRPCLCIQFDVDVKERY